MDNINLTDFFGSSEDAEEFTKLLFKIMKETHLILKAKRKQVEYETDREINRFQENLI